MASEFELLSDEHRQIVSDTLPYQENRFREKVKAAIEVNELPAGAQVRKMVKYLLYSVWGISSMGHFEASKPTLRLVSEAVMEGVEKMRPKAAYKIQDFRNRGEAVGRAC